MATALEKLRAALETIANYLEKRKAPESLGEAEAMLANIGVVVRETLKEASELESGRA